MTTVADARAALVTAVGAAEAEVDPPACYVFSGGSDLGLAGGTSIEWSFRVTCAVGIPGDMAQASTALATLVAAKLTILWALPGWRVISVGGDQTRQIAGGEQFTADITAVTLVQI